MQQEITTANPAHEVHILGINRFDLADGNAGMVDGRTIPWLQDVQNGAWRSWAVTLDDVVVLDGENRVLFVFPVTGEGDLQIPAAYDSLKARMLRAAR